MGGYVENLGKWVEVAEKKRKEIEECKRGSVLALVLLLLIEDDEVINGSKNIEKQKIKRTVREAGYQTEELIVSNASFFLEAMDLDADSARNLLIDTGVVTRTGSKKLSSKYFQSDLLGLKYCLDNLKRCKNKKEIKEVNADASAIEREINLNLKSIKDKKVKKELTDMKKKFYREKGIKKSLLGNWSINNK